MRTSSALWLTFTSTVLLASLLATNLGAIFLQNSRSLLANAKFSGLCLFTRTRVSLPDTTAIILNWSRLPNVIRIVSLLCETRLDDTIAEIVVWNNSPKKLGHRDFSSAECPLTKLKIYNSPENLYFKARFTACAQASTPYCFIQDDDYLVYPEIIQTLRARITDTRRDSSVGIHLLPPHEHLSSALRTLSTPSYIHTSFAWLGYGALISRSQVLAFFELMSLSYLNVSEDEMKMADNFYTVLSNTVQEIWFDQGVELGGGEAFTIGLQGVERNRKYIMRAGEYLDSIVSNNTMQGEAFPFVNLMPHVPGQDSISRAPCLKSGCLLETTIELLPRNMVHRVESATEMLALEQYNLELLDAGRQSHYLKYPPSNAVDGLADTAFCSPDVARVGDSITLNILSNPHGESSSIEFVWLVDSDTESILQTAIFETSQNGIHWTHPGHLVSCLDTNISVVLPSGSGVQPLYLRECSVTWSSTSGNNAGLNSSPQFFRAILEEVRLEKRWCIYEVWMRGG